MCIRDRPYTDLFLYDIKAMDADVHKACTGVENGRILENFTRLADRGENIFVRYPYIPGMNDDQVEKMCIRDSLQGSALCMMGKGQSCDRGVIHLTL